MAMAQAAQTVSRTSYRHRATARQNARTAGMPLFQAFLCFSHQGTTDCRCIKDGTPIDPACGSGNFLTESYLSLRRLENKALKAQLGNNIAFGFEGSDLDPIQVTIQQFYGIEINDFAVAVAKTALWIAEAQMFEETQTILNSNKDFLPLETFTNIHEGNALRLDWNTVVDRRTDHLFIMGNPPFVGASFCTAKQKKEIVDIVGKIKLSNSLDYVVGWYYKAAEIIQGTTIKCAFVSTNSITQGEQVEPMWNGLLHDYGIHILFAYRTFIWNSEANDRAHVHCVIIGFSSNITDEKKVIINDAGLKTECNNINPYLLDAPDVLISSRSKPLCNVPLMTKGNQPSDGGNLILDENERNELIRNDPSIEKFVHRYIGAKDYLNNNEVRYCLWLKDADPSEYMHNKEIMRRINAVKEMREKSSADPTRKSAEWPYRFFSTPQTNDTYIIIPRVSSERRKYIPMGFMPPEVIAADSLSIICGASIYHFGILSSSVHMAWMRTVAGRLEMRYRYSGSVVYNNYPWPDVTEEQRKKIESAAKQIIDARNKYPKSSLADMYDPNNAWAYPELVKAHRSNDTAVMEAYGFSKDLTEPEIVSELMKMYQTLINEK